MPAVRLERYDLKDVDVFNTRGKRVGKKEVVRRLKQETVAVAFVGGQKADPLHLRVLRDDLLVFVLPPPRGLPGFRGIAPPGVPVPQPAPLLPPGAEKAPQQPPALPPAGGGAGGLPALPPPGGYDVNGPAGGASSAPPAQQGSGAPTPPALPPAKE
jgi:hypothetical protein